MAAHHVAIVTGANKGIGLAIVRNLALRYRSSELATFNLSNSTHSPSFRIYLTARSAERGQAAISTLRNDEQLSAAKSLQSDGGAVDVVFKQLDVGDLDSIKAFEQDIHEAHGDSGVHILVNNAGISLPGDDPSNAAQTIETNYTAPLLMTQTFLPLLSKARASRVVNMSSMLGKIGSPKYSPELFDAFRAAKTIDDVTALMDRYVRAVERRKWEEDGWPGSSYAVSKAGLTGATMILGKMGPKVWMAGSAFCHGGGTAATRNLGAHRGREGDTSERDGDGGGGKAILMNACCPGYVKTEMTKGRGRRTPDQGAKTPVHLALGDLHGVTGEFWENEEVSSWVAK